MSITSTYQFTIIGGDTAGDRTLNTFQSFQQLTPDVLGLSGGGFVVAYNNVDAADGFVELNFYDAAGVVIGVARQAWGSGSGTTDAVGQPKLAELDNGNVLVAWEDDNGTNDNAGVRASIYTATGQDVAVNLDLLPEGSANFFNDVDVTATKGGGFAFTYTSGNNVFMRQFTSTGAPVGDLIEVSLDADVEDDPQVARLSDGALAVAWSNLTDNTLGVRIIEADGTARTEPLLGSLFGVDNEPSIVGLKSGGGFAVVYADTGWEEGGTLGRGISLQIFNNAGQPVGELAQVTADTAADESDPDVTVLANGFLAVTWSKPYSATDVDVWCRVYTAEGVPLSGAFALAGTGSDEIETAVSAMLDGKFITVWQDESGDTDGGSIGGQITELTRTTVGDAANDYFTGDELREKASLGDGADTAYAGGAADTLSGEGGVDTLNGGLGDDIIEGGAGADTAWGDAGADLMYSNTAAQPSASLDGDTFFGGGGGDTMIGASGADWFIGDGGNDKLKGGAGADRLIGADGADGLDGQGDNDTLQGGEGADSLNGGGGDDTLWAFFTEEYSGSNIGDRLRGALGNDSLFGCGGVDTLQGGSGVDLLAGAAGGDYLDGERGKDTLVGGMGGDVLVGGKDHDKDVFLYQDIAESGAAGVDLIRDLSRFDIINLAAIDARTGKAGDQAFELVDALDGHAGQLALVFHTDGDYAGYTTLEGDVNGDAVADFLVILEGDKTAFTHFVL